MLGLAAAAGFPVAELIRASDPAEVQVLTEVAQETIEIAATIREDLARRIINTLSEALKQGSRRSTAPRPGNTRHGRRRSMR